MKRLRILILFFFIIVLTIFSATRLQEYITSDYAEPVISAAEDSLRVSVSATEADLLTGMSASDNLDGDVTDTLVVVSKTKFISKGTLRVNYAAFDKNNNVGTYARNITYTDYRSPHFSMSEPLRFVSGNSNYDYLRYITANDCLDGNITQQIKVTFGDTQSIGEGVSAQRIHLQVTNSAGDSSVLELTARFEEYAIYSQQAPALSEYILYVHAGDRPDYRSFLSGVWSAGKVKSFADAKVDPLVDIRVFDTGVNYNVPGIYSVGYQLSRTSTDKSGVQTTTELGRTDLIVVVED